jgi:hypothetical protein
MKVITYNNNNNNNLLTPTVKITNVKVKVNCTLEQAMKVQRRCRGLATSRPLYPRERDCLPVI